MIRLVDESDLTAAKWMLNGNEYIPFYGTLDGGISMIECPFPSTGG